VALDQLTGSGSPSLIHIGFLAAVVARSIPSYAGPHGLHRALSGGATVVKPVADQPG
jgi:hypothetical protein